MEDQKTLTDIIDLLVQTNRMLSNYVLQLATRFDVLKETVCERHPEIAKKLEERIRKEESSSFLEYGELQLRLAAIFPNLSKSVH